VFIAYTKSSLQIDMSGQRIAVFGTSGFAREAADICYSLNYEKVVLVSREEDNINDFEVIPESEISDLVSSDFVFTIGIGDNNVRRLVYDKFPNLEYTNLIHPGSTFGRHQREVISRQKGNIVTSGAAFTNNIQVGDFSVFNLNCTIGHDCIVESFTNFAPGCNISGNVHVKRGAYIGSNSVVIQGDGQHNKMIIGEGSTVGAGAVVTGNVEKHTVVVGAPAKPIH
jgi:sugar O-acyltransferase (sialic acid O-acetyltransferase NeuD family)